MDRGNEPPFHMRNTTPGRVAFLQPHEITGEDVQVLAEDAAEAEAQATRAALGDGGERFWAGVDEQLRERARQ